MLSYNFENRGKTPLYEYLYNCIKNDILEGNIAPYEKLPSKRDMAKNHGISVITVENAYAQLLVEGYIFSKEKKGYFASEIVGQHIEKENVSYEMPKSKKQWLVNFNSNHIMYDSFPFATWSKVMRKTLLDEENSFLSSPDPKGVWELRLAIAENLSHFRGIKANPENIIVGAGMEYLYGIVVQLLGHSRIIAIEDPGYLKVGKVYESNGLKCLHIKVDKDGLDIEELYRHNAIAVHISPSHHFPTGRVMPVGRRHQLMKWAVENNSYIIEDDYDSEFRFSGRPIPAMAQINSDRVIYMNTFSKTLAPSIRIAYMILPDELMKRYEKKLNFYSSTVSGFEQYTLANFISEGYYERHINRMRNYYREYRGIIIKEIKQSPIYPMVSIEEDNAGLHFILSINKDIDEAQFIRYLKKNNINISAVTDYCYNTKEEYKNKFIINYSAIDSDNLKIALDIMARALLK